MVRNVRRGNVERTSNSYGLNLASAQGVVEVRAAFQQEKSGDDSRNSCITPILPAASTVAELHRQQ